MGPTVRASILRWASVWLWCIVLVHPNPSAANSTILMQWQNLYPTSASANNAAASAINNCALCHSNTTTPLWNAYGFALRQNKVGGLVTTASFISVQGFNSDGDSTGSTNLQEIQASTQPGWTSGNNNTIYNASGVPSNAPPPAGS